VIRFEIEQEIQRPVSEVFAYITDVANLPHWHPGTIRLLVAGRPARASYRLTVSYVAP